MSRLQSRHACRGGARAQHDWRVRRAVSLGGGGNCRGAGDRNQPAEEGRALLPHVARRGRRGGRALHRDLAHSTRTCTAAAHDDDGSDVHAELSRPRRRSRDASVDCITLDDDDDTAIHARTARRCAAAGHDASAIAPPRARFSRERTLWSSGSGDSAGMAEARDGGHGGHGGGDMPAAAAVRAQARAKFQMDAAQAGAVAPAPAKP